MKEEYMKIIICFIFGWDLYIYKDCIVEDIKYACRAKKEPIVLADIFLLYGLVPLIITAYYIFSDIAAYIISIVAYTIYVYAMKFLLKE